MEGGCIFCKIVKKEVPSYIIYEDEKCVAFLDINPATKGTVILVPRIHYETFDFDFETSFHCFKTAIEISKTLKNILGSIDVEIANIRSPTKHFNIRIYPISENSEAPLIQNKPIEISESELNQLWQKMAGIVTKIQEQRKPENKTNEIKKSNTQKDEKKKEIVKKWEKKFLP